MAVRPARPKGFPSGSTISKSPLPRIVPLCLTLNLVVGIFSPKSHKVCRYSCAATSGNDKRPGQAGTLSLHTTQNSENESVLWNGRIHFVGPREDSALEIENLPEAHFTKEIHGFRGALSAPAMRHDFARRIQLMHAPRQLAERNEVPLEIADLVFVRLAHIQDKQIVSMIQPRLKLMRRNLRHLHRWAGSFFAAHPAKFVIVNEFGDRAVRAAHRAVRIFPQFEFTELHSQRVEEQQAPREIFSGAKNELDGFHRLNRANDSRQHAKHTALSARWYKPRRRRFGIQTAVARSLGHSENGDLAFESEDRAVNVRLAKQNAGV